MIKKQTNNMDEYIAGFPPDIQNILGKLRRVIKEAAPEGQETISYGMPTFKLKGKNLVHFAAFKNHVGFYPTPSAIIFFKKELSPYELSKGTIRFPLGTPVPFDVIKKFVRFRINEILSKNK